MGTPTKKATIWVIDLMPHSSSGPKHTMSTLKCLCGRASMDEKCKKTSPPLSVFLSTPSSSALLSTAVAAWQGCHPISLPILSNGAQA